MCEIAILNAPSRTPHQAPSSPSPSSHNALDQSPLTTLAILEHIYSAQNLTVNTRQSSIHCARCMSDLDALLLRNNGTCTPVSKTANGFHRFRGARLILNNECDLATLGV